VRFATPDERLTPWRDHTEEAIERPRVEAALGFLGVADAGLVPRFELCRFYLFPDIVHAQSTEGDAQDASTADAVPQDGCRGRRSCAPGLRAQAKERGLLLPPR